MGVIILLVIVVFRIMLAICNDWLGLSVLTTIFITLSLCSVLFSFIEIGSVKNSKEKIKKAKKYKAAVLSKEEVHGYKGRTTYTFELEVEDKTVKLSKDNVHRELEINQIVDVYPSYDEMKNVIGFDFVEDVEMNAKFFMPIFIFAIGTSLTSVFFVLIDMASFMTPASNIITAAFLLLLFLPAGISSMKRALINKNGLIPVKAKIDSLKITTYYDFGDPPMPPSTSISPIYRVEVAGEIYQFLGDQSVKEEDKGKEVTVYYDKDTMEFFDKPKSNSDLVLGIIMLVLSVTIICSLV